MNNPPHAAPCLLPTAPLPQQSRWRVAYPVGFLTAVSVTGPDIAGIGLDTRCSK